MDCKRANELLLDYVYQELEDGDADRIEAHVRRCDACSSGLAGLEDVRLTLRQLPELEPPPGVARELMVRAAAQQAAAVRQPEPAPWLWSRLVQNARLAFAHPAMTAAAMLVIVTGISVYAYRHTSPPSVQTHADRWTVAPPAAGGSASGPDEVAEQVTREPQVAGRAGPTDDRKDRLREEADEGAAASIAASPVIASGKSGDIGDQQRPEHKYVERSGQAQRAGPAAAAKGRDREQANRVTGGTRGLWNARPRPKKSRARKLASAPAGPARSAPQQEPRGSALAAGEEADRRSAVDANEESSPRRKSESSTGESRSSDRTGLEELARADVAAAEGRCEVALRRYAAALRLDPSLRTAVARSVRGCLQKLEAAGDTGLRRARSRFPGLRPLMPAPRPAAAQPPASGE